MVALPTATAVTTPAELTVAIAVLLLDQVTLLLVALLGATVAANVVVPPILVIVAEVGETVTPVTDTTPPDTFTVMVLVVVHPPGFV
jgi:hypothetical protein